MSFLRRIWFTFLWLLSGRRRHAVLMPPTVAEVERRLHECLWKLARRLWLPIFIQGADKMQHQGLLCAGQYRHHAIRHIVILDRQHDNPWVLAHEIGHHNLFRAGSVDHAEHEADEEALRIVRKLLAPYEMDVVCKVAEQRLDGSGTVKAPSKEK